MVPTAVSLAVERGVPLSLMDRRRGRLLALGAWGRHVGIRIVMGIGFSSSVPGVSPLVRPGATAIALLGAVV